MAERVRLSFRERLCWWRRWAGRNPLFWWSLLLAFVSLAIPLYVSPPYLEPSIRVIGAVLQLIGIATVAVDLLGVGKQFRKRAFASTLAWLKAIVVGPKTVTISVSANVDLGDASVRASGTVRPRIDPARSTDHRLATLERYVGLQDETISALRSELHDELKSARRKFDDKVESVRASLNASQQRLHDVAVGNYSLLLFGAAWLAVGVLVSVSPDLYRLVALAFS